MSWNDYHSKNILASVSKYVGRHNITYGFDYRRIITGPTLSLNSGQFTFNGVFSREYLTTNNNTGADFADVLLGYPSGGTATAAVPIMWAIDPLYYTPLYYNLANQRKECGNPRLLPGPKPCKPHSSIHFFESIP